MVYTTVFSKPFYANSILEASEKARAECRDSSQGHVLLAVRTQEEHQAALSRGEVG
jgi:hypothetical protein